jgi:hypothetical protein
VSRCGVAGIAATAGGCSLSSCTLTHNGSVDVVAQPSVSTTGLASNVRIVTDVTSIPALVDRIALGAVRPAGEAPITGGD